MRLLERYSLATGLRIGKQYLTERFFPLPFTRYITLQASSGMGGKNYPFYSTVVDTLKPYLTQQNIEIVQLGAKDDPVILGCYHTMGKDSFGQGAYIIRGSMLHLGNDSIWGHRAGHIGIPMVQLWGPTHPDNHSSLEADPAKTIYLQSHRWNRKPTFMAQENPMSIALIDPYDVVRAVLKLLNIENTITQRTLNIGPAFSQGILELVPNCCPDPNFQAQLPLVVRYDLLPNEEVLAQVLSTGRKVNLIAKSEINVNLLAQFRTGFASFNYETKLDSSIDYIVAVKRIVPNATFFTRETDVTRLAELRFKFFDIVTIQQHVDKNRADFEKATQEYINDPSFSLDKTLQSGILEFKSNKHVLSNGKIYASFAHESRGLPIGAPGWNKVIDEHIWWRDMNHMMVYQ